MDPTIAELLLTMVRVLAELCSPLWVFRIHPRLYIPAMVLEGVGVILVFVLVGRSSWFRYRWWSYPLLGVMCLAVLGWFNVLVNAWFFHPD